jgi:hypothetical protein
LVFVGTEFAPPIRYAGRVPYTPPESMMEFAVCLGPSLMLTVT